MSNEVIDVKVNTPETIAIEIRTIQGHTQQILMKAAVEIGKRLIEAKELVDHGEWASWLENEVDFSQSSANKYMQLAEKYDGDLNSESITNLSYTKALKLLSIPEEDREEFVEEVKADEISVSELQAEIEKYKAENKELSSENESLQKDVEKKEKELASVSPDSSSDDEDIEKEVEKRLAKKEKELEKQKKSEIKEYKTEAEAANERAKFAEKKASQSNNENVVTFKVMTKDFQATFMDMLLLVDEVGQSDSEQADKMKVALKTILDSLQSKL